MFDIDGFVDECRAARAERDVHRAVREVLSPQTCSSSTSRTAGKEASACSTWMRSTWRGAASRLSASASRSRPSALQITAAPTPMAVRASSHSQPVAPTTRALTSTATETAASVSRCSTAAR